MMSDTQTTARPVAITVICILGFIGAALAIPLIFSAAARGIGAWYPPYLALTTVIGLTWAGGERAFLAEGCQSIDQKRARGQA